MKKSNTVKNSTLLSNFLLFLATILSILLIVASPSSSPMPSSLSSVAFASHGGGYHGDRSISDIAKDSNNNNQVGEEEEWSLIGNLISQQQSPQAYARNVNVDDKVIIVEDCDDSEIVINDNDKIIQANTQSFNQEANNQVGEEEDDDG
jgi:hypothetical protein